MPTLKFLPSGLKLPAEPNTKILVSARRAKLPIRFGCASCRCGTCAVSVQGNGNLSVMEDDERALLARMGLAIDGTVRLSCRARILQGEVSVDLGFQSSYEPVTDEGGD